MFTSSHGPAAVSTHPRSVRQRNGLGIGDATFVLYDIVRVHLKPRMTPSQLFADARCDAGLEPATSAARVLAGSVMPRIGDASHEQWMDTKSAGSGRGGHTH